MASAYAARAHKEALDRNRRGDFQGASTIISRTAQKIFSYAGNDPVILEIARTLEREAAAYLERLAPMAMKQRQFDAKNMLRHRDSTGKSRRADRGETYSLDTATGHPVIDLGGVRALVDTGSPLSFGKPLHILGETHRPGPGLGLVNVEEISRCIGERIDVLLGTDILAQYSFTVDWDGGRISFTRDTDALPGGRTIDTSLRHGVPCLELTTRSASALAFLDTDAKLSYMDARAVNGTRSLGEEEDFFPAVGRFRVPVYQREVRIAGMPMVMQFGRAFCRALGGPGHLRDSLDSGKRTSPRPAGAFRSDPRTDFDRHNVNRRRSSEKAQIIRAHSRRGPCAPSQ